MMTEVMSPPLLCVPLFGGVFLSSDAQVVWGAKLEESYITSSSPTERTMPQTLSSGAPGLAGRLATVASVVLAASICRNGAQAALRNEHKGLCVVQAPQISVSFGHL